MFMAIGAEAKKPWNGFLPKGRCLIRSFSQQETSQVVMAEAQASRRGRRLQEGGDRGVALDRGRGMGLGIISKMYLMNVFT